VLQVLLSLLLCQPRGERSTEFPSDWPMGERLRWARSLPGNLRAATRSFPREFRAKAARGAAVHRVVPVVPGWRALPVSRMIDGGLFLDTWIS